MIYIRKSVEDLNDMLHALKINLFMDHVLVKHISNAVKEAAQSNNLNEEGFFVD